MAHIPVLLQECLTVLAPKAGERFADGTLGAGGHAREIVARITPGGVLLATDRDPRAVAKAKDSLQADKTVRVFLEAASYAQLPKLMQRHGITHLDGLLLDLGFSSEQLAGGELAGRGFSFTADEPLLMTYSDEDTPVVELLAELTDEHLASVIREYGEERYAREIAESISHAARHEGIATTGALVEAIRRAVPRNYEHGRLHPATRTFQALRIFANKELEHLQQLLESLPSIMAKNGRVAIISFHSLEDRIVKHYFQSFIRNSGGRSVWTGQHDHGHAGEPPNSTAASERPAQLLTKKPITASEAEIAANPRSRSAKLRGIQFH